MLLRNFYMGWQQAFLIASKIQVVFRIHAKTIQILRFKSCAIVALVAREAVALWDATLAKVHNSPASKEYMRRNMYEDVYMSAEEMTRWLVSEQEETTRFLTEMGLVAKKDEKK